MMASDNLQEFVVNPWKVELVGAFFQSGIKKRENERMPPLVFEDCDVSTICVASGTTYDSLKVVENTGLWREYRQVEKYSLAEEVSSATPVVLAMPISLAKPVSSTSPVSSATLVSLANPVSSARPLSSAKPKSSARPVSSVRPVSVRPVSTGRPVSSCTQVYSAELVFLSKPVKIAKSKSTTAKTEVAASSKSSYLPISSTVGFLPASTQVSKAKEVPSKSIASLACSSAVQIPGSQLVSTLSPISSTRPALIKKPSPKKSSLPPTIPVPPVTSQDCGSTCVSVILKSSRLDPKAARLNTVANRQRQVEQLVSNYNLKFSHKSSPGVQVRLDYCFHQPGDARQFYKSVTSLVQSQPPPRLLSCILMTEADLGYQHQPVLTEHDLLAIQSPEYCRNLFRTSILIKVVQEEDVVVYHFKSVTDVNRFLYNKSSSVHTRSLGLLRRNVVPKRLIPDDEGYFRLFSAEYNISEKLSKKHKFMIFQGQRNENDSLLDGNYLLFSSKLDLFKFLVSDDAADIEHLQFDGKKIMGFGEVNEDRKGNKLQENIASLFDKLKQNVYERKGNVSREISDQKVFEKSLQCSTDDIIEKTILVSKTAPDSPSVQKEIKFIKSVHSDKDKLEMNGISLLDNVQNLKDAEPRREGEGKVDRVKSALLMKEEEIRSLKKKLMFKEEIIQAEIVERTTAKSSLEQALSQLDKINQLSLSVARNKVKAE